MSQLLSFDATVEPTEAY